MELLFPTRCVSCDAVGRGRICVNCRPGGPLRPPIAIDWVSGLIALATYEQPPAQVVRATKYSGDRQLGLLLGELLADRLGGLLARDGFDAVVPVPTPAWRRVSRGFELPTLLAEPLADRLGVPVHHALTQHGGPQQAAVSAERRRENLAGRVRSRYPVRGRVLLVDDVVTTGATTAACARELLGDRTREVFVATLCVVAKRAPVAVLREAA